MKKNSGWSVFENNPFIDGLFEWMGSLEGQLADDVREFTWQSLQNVTVDACDRKLIWDDGKRLSIDQSVRRIHADYPQFPVDMIEDKLIAWLDMVFAPESYSREQLDELDRLTEAWIADHNGQRKNG